MCQLWNSFINSYQRVEILGVVLTYTTLVVAVLSTQYAVGAFITMSLILYYIWDDLYLVAINNGRNISRCGSVMEIINIRILASCRSRSDTHCIHYYVVYSGLISSYRNNTWGRYCYQDPFEHRTKGRILISYAIILPIVVDPFNYPHGRMLSHMLLTF